MGKNLENSVAIVTGASSGIGRETAILLARKKVKVVLAARRENKLEEVAQEIAGLNGEVLAIPMNVSDSTQVERMVDKTLECFGKIDILINNAGFGLNAPIAETSSDDLREIMGVNLMGTFYVTKAVLPQMKKQGSGHIINISSIAGKRGFPFLGAYCATKFAMNAISEALRVELVATGIHVSLVYPVTTETEFFNVMKNKTGKRFEPPKMFRQSACKVAHAIVKCAENPRPEVLPFPLARLLFMINSTWPGILDFILRRYYKSVL
ncbi:MAG TPA: SDR family NAD(P)-dependent oxidoreductase [Thermodesulfobacteriota bacterium]|nr:SDR family NAD(P)-dependent oxidoreductase [Thermodesulfobacteriota bacterium]